MRKEHITFMAMVALSLTALCTTSFKTKRITKEEATKIAEDYVRNNGYTTAPVDTLTHKLDNDEIPNATSAALLKMRYNMLSPKALFVNPDGKGWYAVFEINTTPRDSINQLPGHPKKLGSIVYIRKSGNVEMSCMDLILENEK